MMTKTMRLHELRSGSMLAKIAAAMVAAHGEYLCKIDGKKVRVVK